MPAYREAARYRFGTRTVALGLALLFLNSCATIANDPPSGSYQEHLGQVAIVATEQIPELKFEGFVRNKGEGAAVGAGGTFVACVGGIGGGGCSGAFCGAALALILGICSVASLFGGVAGAVAAPSTEQVAASESAFNRAIEVRNIQQSLRLAVADAASAAGVNLPSLPDDDARLAATSRDYRALAGRGIDTVLETTLTKAGTSGFGINAPSAAYIEAHVRVVEAATNTEKVAATYTFQGRRLLLSQWSANQARPLLEELENGYRRLGKLIYENIFELHAFPDRGPHSAGGMMSSAFGLAPIYPPTRGTLTGDQLIGPVFEWFAVDSLRPQLKWAAFPRDSDRTVAAEAMARVSKVRYELVIAKEENMMPAEIVYRREGLSQPEHLLDISLDPGSRYFWSVRAHFELDGHHRVTEWGSTHFAARERMTAPSQYSYRFRTPSRR